MQEAQNMSSFCKNKIPLRGTIFLGVSWFLFIIIYLIMYAGSHSMYVHIGVFLLSLLVVIGLIVLVWLIWVKRFIPTIGITFLKTFGLLNQIILTLIIPFMILLLLSVYLLFFADSFSFLQNLSMLFISFLSIIIGISLVWKKSQKNPFQFVKQTVNPYNSCNSRNEWWK
jgi:hypothetical protein